MLKDKILILNSNLFRDTNGTLTQYEAMAVLEFAGTVDNLGQSRGHYTCDVKDKERNWFRTNDNLVPISIEGRNVSKIPYVVLYKRVSSE